MQNAGSMSAQVAERVRDANFNGATQPQVINLLSYSQQVINGILGDVTGTASLLVQPRSTLYQISAFLPAAVKIQAIRDAGAIPPISIVGTPRGATTGSGVSSITVNSSTGVARGDVIFCFVG